MCAGVTRRACGDRGGAPGVVRGTLQLHTGGTTRSFPVDLMAEVDSTEPQLGSTINWDVPGEEMRGDTSVSVQLDLGESCPGGGRTVHPASGGIALGETTGVGIPTMLCLAPLTLLLGDRGAITLFAATTGAGWLGLLSAKQLLGQ